MDNFELCALFLIANLICIASICNRDYRPTANDTWCYKFYSEGKTWDEAEETCWADESHLIQFQPKHDWDMKTIVGDDNSGEVSKNDSYIWVGLRRIFFVFQWIGDERIMLKSRDKWGLRWASSEPMVWNGCGAVNRDNGELHAKKCDVTKLQFVCVHKPTRDIQLSWSFRPNSPTRSVKIIVKNDNSGATVADDDYLLWITEEERFSTLLVCQLTIDGEIVDFHDDQSDFEISWIKNGIPMHRPIVNVMHPNAWRTETPWATHMGRILDIFGTYQCEIRGNGSLPLQSKPLSIFIKGLQSMKYDITVDFKGPKSKKEVEASSCTSECFFNWHSYVAEIVKRTLLKANLPSLGIRNITWMLHYISPVDVIELVSGGTVSRIKVSLFAIVNKSEDNVGSPEEIRQVMLDNSGISYVKNATVLGHCEAIHEKDSNGRYYDWPKTGENSREMSDPLCVTDKPRNMVVKRLCEGTYWDEAKYDLFNYSVCTLKITHLFEDEICPSGHKLVSDDICVKNLTVKTNWTMAIAECTKLGSHLPHNSKDVTSTSQSAGYAITSWSEARLNGRKIYPQRPNQPTGQYNMTNCVILIGNKDPPWQRANCESKQSFICVSRIQDSLWKVPWCPRGWWGTEISTLRKNCYFINPSMVASEAERQNACFKKGAILANTSNPLLHVLIRNTLKISSPDKLVEFLNETGFIHIDFLVCQNTTTIQSPRKPRLVLQSSVMGAKDYQTVELICHGTNLRPNSRIIWYQNGDPYPQMQRKKKSSSDSEHLASAIVQLDKAQQGDYWCEAWDNNGRNPISSNKVTLVLPSINNCVIVLNTGNSTLPDIFELSNISSFFNLAETNILRQEVTLLDDGQLVIWVHMNSHRTQEDAVRLVRSYFEKHIKHFSKDIAETLLVRSTEWCLHDTTTSSSGTLIWQRTRRMRAALPKELCFTFDFNPVYRECIGDFRRGAFWGPVIGECLGKPSGLTLSLYNLSQTEIDKNNAFDLSNSLNQLTQDTENDLQPVDVAYIAKTMKKISVTGNVTNQTFQNVVGIVNSVMNIESEKVFSSQLKLQSSNKITESLEQMVQSVELEPGKGIQFSLANIDIDAHLMAEDETIIGVSSFEHKQETITLKVKRNVTNVDVSLMLPVDLVKSRKEQHGREGLRLSFVVYHNSRLFVPSKASSGNPTVISKIISAQLSGPAARNLLNPVQIVFRPIPEMLRTGVTFKPESMSCVYWDPDLNQNQGDWSSAGCSVVAAYKSNVTCECNHLTNFAVLMDVYGQDERVVGIHREALETITYIGCAISITGLSLTILTFLLFSKWRKKDGNKIVFNLALALLLLMIIFLAGIQQAENPTVCQVVAILLHYFILVAFCWMLVEAVQQYLLFVRVFDTYIPRFLLKSIIFAWGVPLIIVVIVIGVDIDQYKGKYYCWMNLTASIYAFLLPLGIIITINSIVFIMVLRGITCRKGRQLGSNQSRQQLVKTQIYAGIFIFVLLGVSWIFGFFGIGGARITFQYIFCICNSLQGFFIFIFMVVRDRNAQDLWQTLCVCKESKKVVGTTTSFGMHPRRGETNSDNFTTKLMVSRTSLHPSQ